MSHDCVVDASVAIKLFVEEDLSSQATALIGQLGGVAPPALYVPDHFFIECANVLWKYVRLHGYDREAALEDLRDLRQLPWHSVAARDLAQASVAVGVDHGIAAYDAAYVVLSEVLHLPLVTADRKLCQALVQTPYDIRWLGDWPLPPGT